MPDLGERGSRLHAAYVNRVDEAGLVLLEEAARLADRLDKLDALLRGDIDTWCRLVHNTRTQDYEIKVDSALSEARQQALALRQLISSLPLKESDGGDDDGWLEDVYSTLRDASG